MYDRFFGIYIKSIKFHEPEFRYCAPNLGRKPRPKTYVRVVCRVTLDRVQRVARPARFRRMAAHGGSSRHLTFKTDGATRVLPRNGACTPP